MPLIWCSISKPIIFHSKATLNYWYCSLNFRFFFGLEYRFDGGRATKSITRHELSHAIWTGRERRCATIQFHIHFNIELLLLFFPLFLSLWTESRVWFFSNGWRERKSTAQESFLGGNVAVRREWTMRDASYTVITEFYWLKNKVGSCSVPSMSSKW